MNSRTIYILIFVLGALVLGVVALLFFIQSQDQPQQQVTNGETAEDGNGIFQPDDSPTATPALVEVVVSLQTVPRGFQITADNLDDILTTDLRKPEDVATNVLLSREDAIGLYARTDIFQGETITRDTLVRDPTTIASQEFGPSSLIPPGFLAVSIPVNAEGSAVEQLVNLVALGVSEGDFVDILLTFDLFRIDPQFQTYLENDAAFFLEQAIETTLNPTPDPESDEPPPASQGISLIGQLRLSEVSPFGRFEELPTEDLVMIGPSEFQRPVHIGLVLQNAKVIQLGLYQPPESPTIPTPTPEVPDEEAEDEGPPPPTPTPLPPNVLVVALSPQQQLFLNHALKVGADIDLALRGANDSQLFMIENVDLDFLLDFFNIEIPPNFDYTLVDPDTARSGGAGGNGNGNGNGQPATEPETVPEGG